MDSPEHREQRQPLTGEQSMLSDASSAVTTTNQHHAPFARHRPGYSRVPSVPVIDEQVIQGGLEDIELDVTQFPRSMAIGHGLGIALDSDRTQKPTIHPAHRPATPDNAASALSPQTPGSAKPLMSLESGFSGSTRYQSHFGDYGTSYTSPKHLAQQSQTSLRSFAQPSIYANSEAGLLSTRSRYDDFAPEHNCRSKKNFKQDGLTWLSATVILASVYSTVFSLIFLLIAIGGPRYGRMISTNGVLTISGATVLVTLFAKTIELTFVTVIVTFLGQALARRAHDKNAVGGITLAEMSMRSWIMQPGTIATNWQSVRYAGSTILGGVALLAAVMATLYVTSANALVQPQLKFNNWRPTEMKGLVKTSFANPTYVGQNCKTPITAAMDPEYAATTCLQIEHAAMGYHNYFAYLNSWTDLAFSGNGTKDLAARPKGFALLNDNTTITAPWIEIHDPAQLEAKYGHTIINVSMAMPHAGVVSAAIDPVNKIMQPQDLDGLGIYSIWASVPSPVVHVLCATLTEADLDPLLIREGANYTDPYLGGTPLDAIFSWGEAYGVAKWPPLFSQLPIGFNTIVNHTTGIAWGRDSVYLLGNSNASLASGETAYSLCGIKVSQTPFCSTRYNASSSGGTLEAICEDFNNGMAYNHSLSNATSGNVSISQDWPNIASEWILSLALNDGSVKANGSNSRLLTELIPLEAELSLSLPSISEALAVMAGCTLLQSAQDAPFVEFYNYSSLVMTPGQYQYFNASIRAQQYASGGTAPYQKGFIVVLLAVFVLNLFALIYFLSHRQWYTDVSEPSNLFSLAINSPPSKELAESCGGGPHGEQFRSSWKLQDDRGHVYMESQERSPSGEESPNLRKRKRLSEGFDMMMSPVRRATERGGWGQS